MRHAAWRRRAVVVALALVAVLPQGAAAVTAPPRVKEAVLTTGLRIEWTGVKGMRLRLPSKARLPLRGAHVYLRGGTYASVRMGRVHPCGGGDVCGGAVLEMDYTRNLVERIYQEYPAGERHVGWVTNGGEVPAGVWDLYLFTDGQATIVFDETGLERRARTVTPAGRVRGGFQFLREFCGMSYCTPGSGYAGRLRTGGATGDTGKWGLADGWVFHYRRTYDDTPQGLHLRGCAYRQAPGDTGNAVEDHPLGCDDEATQGTTDSWAFNFAASGIPPYASSKGRGMGITDVSGPVYLGYQVGTEHDLVDTEVEAWGVWYEYGIR